MPHSDPCVVFQPSRRQGPSLSPAPYTSSRKKSNSTSSIQPTPLSDEEMRQRIFSNAAVLFPSSNSCNAYEIVYGSRPRNPSEKSQTAGDTPWQYAMLVRRNPSGDFTPLIRGTAWSTAVPWSMALQGLLDTTAAAIHKKLGTARVPPLGWNEELPQYSPSAVVTMQ